MAEPKPTNSSKEEPLSNPGKTTFACSTLGFVTGWAHGSYLDIFEGATKTFALQARRRSRLYATFGGIYAISACTIFHFRPKDDAWNFGISVGVADGLVRINKGLLVASTSAVLYGTCAGLVDAGMRKIFPANYRNNNHEETTPAADATSFSSETPSSAD